MHFRRGLAEGPRLRVHECVAAVEQWEAFGVIELAGEDYVGVSTVSEMEFERIPGCERFLSPAEAEEIRNLARDCPIVCLKISSVSSEAFVVTPSAVEVVPLPNLSQDIVSDALENHYCQKLQD